ncbi:MAG: NAD(P)-dependent oxidoreductase [Clostridium sp.]
MNFPLFIDLKDKKVLIVGAGAIAARRATVLTEFGAKVMVVAPEAGSGVKELAQWLVESSGDSMCLGRRIWKNWHSLSLLSLPPVIGRVNDQRLYISLP